MYKNILLFLSMLLLLVATLYAAGDLDSVSFATYYPSPYGSYNEMRVNKLSVGINYHDYSGTTIADNSLIVEGNVGIGIVTPVYPLDVRNTSGATQIHVSGTGNDDGLYIEGYNFDASASNISSGSSYNGSNWVAKATAASIISQNQGAIGFYGNPGLTKGGIYTPTMHMFMNNNGNVGIGTPDPQARLDVTGGFIKGQFDCRTFFQDNYLVTGENPGADAYWALTIGCDNLTEWAMSGGVSCFSSILTLSAPFGNGWYGACYANSNVGGYPTNPSQGVRVHLTCCKK